MGYENMKDSYYALNDGICVVNFAQMEGDAICYTDLIKVGVALDNGEIVSIDARGYLMNHKDRTIPHAKGHQGSGSATPKPEAHRAFLSACFYPHRCGRRDLLL